MFFVAFQMKKEKDIMKTEIIKNIIDLNYMILIDERAS